MTIIREIQGYAIEWRVYGMANGKEPGTLDASRQFCFMPGCFDESLSQGHEICLIQDCKPKTSPVFARRSDGTLDIVGDDIGLLVTARLIDNPTNRQLLWKIDRHRIRGWSHGWEHFPDGWASHHVHKKDGVTYRDHFREHLLFVSLAVIGTPRMEKTTPVFTSGGPKEVSKNVSIIHERTKVIQAPTV